MEGNASLHEDILAVLVMVTAVGFAAFAILLAIGTWRRHRRVRWPVHDAWIFTLLMVAWAARLTDLAVSRFTDSDLNAPRTIIYFAAMDVAMIWLLFRLARGTLAMGKRALAWDGTTERRNGKERRHDWPQPPAGMTPA